MVTPLFLSSGSLLLEEEDEYIFTAHLSIPNINEDTEILARVIFEC